MKRSPKSAAAVEVQTTHRVGVLRRGPAAQYVGLSLPAFDRITKDGSGPPKVKLAGSVFGFRIVDMDEWLAGRVERRESEAAA